MDHLIRFTTAEGVDGTHHASSLEDAVAFAERIRNAEGATGVRLFRLTELPIEFRTYYRVEVGGAVEHDQQPEVTHTQEVALHGADVLEPEGSGPPPIPSELGPRLVPQLPVDHTATNGRRLFSR